jgi:cGMP-dependent protein kinase 1
MRSLSLLKNDEFRFYIGCVVLILEHLYDKNIIYRDLRPDKLFIDEEGYLKLLDFGTAKLIDGRTFTIIGNPYYMAPEVIIGKGYSISADLWSLGVLAYELATHRVPFGNGEKDPYNIYKSVLESNFVYPSSMRNVPRIKIFIDQLLSQNPSRRGTPESLKSHKLFSGFDWESLSSKKINSPYLPAVDNFNLEISRSLYANKDIYNIFSSEENFDTLQIPRNHENSNGFNWDAEF